jgi:transposase-like protein
MASTTTELIESGTKVDGRGRRIVTAKERETLIAAYQSSGMTQRAFAQREGIKYSTFTSWIQGRRHATAVSTKPHFAEVAVLTGSVAPVTSGELSVQLPDGMLIRGTMAREIGELIRLLRGER